MTEQRRNFNNVIDRAETCLQMALSMSQDGI